MRTSSSQIFSPELLLDAVAATGDGVVDWAGRAPIHAEKNQPHEVPDLATDLDRASELKLIEQLHALDPAAGFWSEETHAQPPQAERYFVIDPIDGTNNFYNGLPLYAINVGYVVEGQMHMAATYAPQLSEMYWAWRDGGGIQRSPNLGVSDRPPRMAVLSVGIQPRNWGRVGADTFLQIATQVRSVRVLGVMALELAWVASGKLDLWIGGGHAWDIWPGSLLLEAAGARLTMLDGETRAPYTQGIALAGRADLVEWACTQLSS